MCDGRCGDEKIEREEQKAYPDGRDARRRIVERTLQRRNVEGVQLGGCGRYRSCSALKGYAGLVRANEASDFGNLLAEEADKGG
jgi:hypothetical protein